MEAAGSAAERERGGMGRDGGTEGRRGGGGVAGGSQGERPSCGVHSPYEVRGKGNFNLSK